GMLGFTGIFIALLVAIGLVSARLSGQTALASWEVASLFIGAVSAVTGVSLFSLGITFNYLISLFYKEPIRQGLFGQPLFKKPLDRHFWWMGSLSLIVGLTMGAGSLFLGLQGWVIARLWLYLLASAMLILVGV